MKTTIPWIAFAVLLALVVRFAFPKVETVPGIPVIVTDTQYVDHVIVETMWRDRWRERVITDTVNVTTEVVISEPVYFPVPDLPRTRGITQVSVPQTHGDTTQVSIVDIWSADGQIGVQEQVQRLYTPGPLLYIEASDPLRADFGTYMEPDPCGFGCRLIWFAGGLAGGVILWELAR